MATQRDEILARACDLYLEKGLEGFSMRSLAREVGVTAPALYRHFDGKEDVLLAVLGEAFKVFYHYLYGSLRGSTPAERLQLAGEAYLDLALDHPRYYEMLHAPLEALGIEELPEEIREQACAVGQFWRDRLYECMDAGFIRRGDPEPIAITMWSHAHGLVSLYLRGALDLADEEAFRRLYRDSSVRVLRGVATDEAAASLDGTTDHGAAIAAGMESR